VSIRIVDLPPGGCSSRRTSIPLLVENKNTERVYTMSEELERRARGDTLTHSVRRLRACTPANTSLGTWTDQWGKTNRQPLGATFSIFDPVLGVGGHYHRITPLYNVSVGGKVIFSLPTAAVQSVSEDLDDGEVIDPLLTAAAVVRVPFGRSNYGVVLVASTNGEVGIGISLLNMRLLPVIP
jgi:hypothetical protein